MESADIPRATAFYMRGMGENEIAELDAGEVVDWEAIARQALQGTSGNRKLTRVLLRSICKDLASGIPLETASRKHGLQPHNVRQWEEIRPQAWQAIEKARAQGELLCLKNMQASKDWRAHDRLLQLQNERYAPKSDQGTQSNGPTIQVILNVPIPALRSVGEQAKIIEADVRELPSSQLEPINGAEQSAVQQASNTE